MNWRHLSAFFWLRWRLRVNQLKRAGILNAIIVAVFAAAAIPGAVLLFILATVAGVLLLPLAAPPVQMLVWDGVVLGFLFCWSTGVVADLQRAETLALDRFLRLPVSLTGAFVINFVSAVFGFNTLVFVPVMVGLSVGEVFGQGPAMAVLFPLVAAFLFAVTAVTYQFQGWLASLMSNPRRRRTVIVLVTAVFVIALMLPNVINVFRPWEHDPGARLGAEKARAEAELFRALQARTLPPNEVQRRLNQLRDEYRARQEQAEEQALERARAVGWWLNVVVPIGWLPFGAAAAAEGDVLPGVLGSAGLGLIGAASLWRAYRTTVRLYTGQFSSRPRRAAAPPPPAVPARAAAGTLLEWRLPGVPEPASAIALAGVRALWRAPEVKMVLLSPLVIGTFFAGIFLAQDVRPPLLLRPVIALGAVLVTYLALAQLSNNQFGYDRAGFRAYVLGPVSRRDVLLGKNLALAPLAMAFAAVMVVLAEVILPMRLDHFVTVAVLTPATYLLGCVPANLLSILAPYPVAAGSMRPANRHGFPVLMHALVAFLYPLLLGPAFVPFGVDYLLEWLVGPTAVPAGLVLALLGTTAVVALYPHVLGWQGRLLWMREQKVLDVVTSRAEA